MTNDDDRADTAWSRIEAVRRHQQHRTLAIALGDIFADLAWCYIHRTAAGGPNLRHSRTCAGLLMKAVEEYQFAGLSRRARSAWRYARLLHRAQTREATS